MSVQEKKGSIFIELADKKEALQYRTFMMLSHLKHKGVLSGFSNVSKQQVAVKNDIFYLCMKLVL